MIRRHSTTLHVMRCDGCGKQTRNAFDGFSDEDQAVREAIGLGWHIQAEHVEQPDGSIHEIRRDLCGQCRIHEPS